MNEPVKSGRRQRNADATRARVLGAAEALFVRDGYTATTIAAIAESADVAVQTVYASFGNKRTVLTELLRLRVVGDDDADTPLRERVDWRAMEAESDGRRQLMLLAGIATSIGKRMAALYGVLEAAAGSDPDIGEVHRRQQHARWRDQRRVADSLAARGALRPGLTATQATDILWTLANPTTYRALVAERRWALRDYEQLLGSLLAGALLGGAAWHEPEPEGQSGDGEI